MYSVNSTLMKCFHCIKAQTNREQWRVVILALKTQRQEDQEFRIRFWGIVSGRLAWATLDPVSKNKQQQYTPKQTKHGVLGSWGTRGVSDLQTWEVGSVGSHPRAGSVQSGP